MQEAIVKLFDAPHGSQLVVENVEGPISVTGWAQPQIQVSATPDQEWAEVEIEQHDQTVVARTTTEQGRNKWSNWFSGSRTPRVEYDVHVPHATDLEIKNVEGPITIQGCNGKIRVRNVEGEVTLDGTQGDISVETVNGPLKASHLQGNAKLKTVNGKLTLGQSELGALSAQTVNGKIEAAATWAPDAQISLNTVNGNCDLTVPPDLAAKVSAHGINLRVTCPGAKTVERQFGAWHGTIGNHGSPDREPQAEIAFHTVNGHLRIDDSGASAATTAQMGKQPTMESEPVQVKVAPHPTESPAPSEKAPAEKDAKSQLEILQMVERGEITVEQAIEILDA
jgi:hypothetical protein